MCIRAYRQGEIRIGDAVFRETVIVSASAIETAPGIKSAADLSNTAIAGPVALRMREMEPELVLVGTGLRQVFPPTQFRAQFLNANIGIEAMDSGAACRTFNVLVGEQRRDGGAFDGVSESENGRALYGINTINTVSRGIIVLLLDLLGSLFPSETRVILRRPANGLSRSAHS